ncbi:MAG: hypothetical protein CMJ83_19815 [Planctomycetes bacterium]|jgi:hypothetical protein|nr:hypothetical protein [Planctomycetota bacterium]
MVEAIEDLFVPIAIYNNVKGRDAKVLKRYREPAWNNPVTRFVDASGADVIPRRDRVWTTAGVADRMLRALEKDGRKIPPWFSAFAKETRMKKPPTGANLKALDASVFRLVAPTPAQATALEARLKKKRPVKGILSPRQLALAKRVRAALKKRPKRFDGITRPVTWTDVANVRAAIESKLK